MPRLHRPPLHPQVAAAVRALGASPTRVAILSYLARHPGATISEIGAATDARPTTLHPHLRELIDLELVTADPPDDRAGKTVQYTAHPALVRLHVENLAIAAAPLPGGFDPPYRDTPTGRHPDM